MKLADISPEKVVLIIGAPRSGTTWLAKIFDSHPDVLYRHEPDTVVRTERLPWMCSPSDRSRYADVARDYVRTLLDVATLKTAGSRPMFPKSYRGTTTHGVRTLIAHGLRAMEQIPGAKNPAGRTRIPDMIDPSRNAQLRIVLKSVSSRGRARLYADALPGCRVIFVQRDPWGQVASMMRGAAHGKFGPAGVPVDELLATEQAARYDLTPKRFASLSLVEQFAWNWAILNEKAIEDLAGHAHVKVLRYRHLCSDPRAEARALFSFAGLSWAPQTERFIARSTVGNGHERYYDVYRDTSSVLNRWRSELSSDGQRVISDIVAETPFASVYPPGYE